MELQTIKIKDLKPAVYNPRKDLKAGDKEYDKIKKSILEFGYIDPIIVNNDYTIIGGHQRYKVLKDLKYNDVQCIVLNIDKTKEKALNIALNKISGEWDFPLLKDLIQEIDTGEIDIELTGFDFESIENLLNFEKNNLEIDITNDIHGENPKELYDKYMNSSIKQIILTFRNEEYNKIIETLEIYKQNNNLNNNTECFIHLLEGAGYAIFKP